MDNYDSTADKAARESGKSWQAFREVVERRRSIRKFDGNEVPREVIDNCIDAAILSPNSSNLQPWEFWVLDPELRKDLIPICLNQNAAKTSGGMVAIIGRRETWREHAEQLLQDYPGDAPAIVEKYYRQQAPFVYSHRPAFLRTFVKWLTFTLQGRQKPTARQPVSQAEHKLWITKTCSLAAQTFMLAATAQGYDTCPMEGFDEVRAAKLLKLPADAWIVMFIAIGKRTDKGIYGARYRVPREQVVRYVSRYN